MSVIPLRTTKTVKQDYPCLTDQRSYPLRLELMTLCFTVEPERLDTSSGFYSGIQGHRLASPMRFYAPLSFLAPSSCLQKRPSRVRLHLPELTNLTLVELSGLTSFDHRYQ